MKRSNLERFMCGAGYRREGQSARSGATDASRTPVKPSDHASDRRGLLPAHDERRRAWPLAVVELVEIGLLGRLGVNLGASRVVPRLSGSLTMHVVDRKVIVVGGGVSGLCVAYYLRRAGAAVRVLETRRVGSGASSGNAGWVTPAQAGPLPEPGLVGYGVRSLFEPRAPLYIEPRQLVRMLPWLLGFARRCNEADHREGRLALGTLGQRCLGLLEGMAADGVDFELHRVPLLAAAIDTRQAHTFLSRLEPLSRLGFRIPSEVLGQEDLRSLEPTLTDAARAGFVIEQHSVVEPQALLAALTRRLKELEVRSEREAKCATPTSTGPV
jgi:glycine/D-amino acid oxidase-like deaminating enzyme